MKLTQIRHNGALAAAIVEDGKYRPVPNQTTASLIVQAQASGKPLAEIGEQLRPRDGPVYASADAIRNADIAKLPDERYGLVMVFRTFDHASFALVMQASRPVSVLDLVTNP